MKTVIYNNPKYYKIVEYTAAGTYTFTAPKTTQCKINIVGAGGGGASCHFMAWERGRNGGQGAQVLGTADIVQGTSYTIVVGSAGIGQRIADSGGSANGTAGGDSSAFGNIAGGGQGSGAHTGYYDGGSDWGGDGGVAQPASGNSGSNGANYSTAPKYMTYGAGGIGNSSTASNGTGGYVSITYESDSSDYTYIVDDFTAFAVKDENDVYSVVK